MGSTSRGGAYPVPSIQKSDDVRLKPRSGASRSYPSIYLSSLFIQPSRLLCYPAFLRGPNGFGCFSRAVTVPRQSEPCCKRKHSEVRGRALGAFEGFGLSCSRVVAHYVGELSKPAKPRAKPRTGCRRLVSCELSGIVVPTERLAFHCPFTSRKKFMYTKTLD